VFSIIIPLYNKAPYIEKAIRSVAAQTCHDFELIVIDDGSTDIAAPQPPKGGVIISYSDIEALIGEKGFLLKQSNSGVSNTRNIGVKLAKYDHIAFLDADDWWAPTFLEEMKALITQYPEAGIYGSSYFKVKNGKHIPANIGVESGFQHGLINYFQVYAKTMWMPLTSISVVIRKSVFNLCNGFNIQLRYSEDYDLWVRIALKYNVAFLNKTLAYYNQDVNSDTRAISGRLHPSSEDFIFNTDYLSIHEYENPDFKYLIDLQRVTCLDSYYYNKERHKDVLHELKKVSWNALPSWYFFKYKIIPYFIGKIFYKVRKAAVKFKNK
jgi:glycosyltransferase involved in cell wall biosynthesis